MTENCSPQSFRILGCLVPHIFVPPSCIAEASKFQNRLTSHGCPSGDVVIQHS